MHGRQDLQEREDQGRPAGPGERHCFDPQDMDALDPAVQRRILRQAERGGYGLMGTRALKTLLDGGEACLVVDARDPEAFEDDHIRGAVNFTLENSRLARLCKRCALRRFLGRDKARTVVFYCTRPTCSYSDSAPRCAAGLGYANVYRYFPGIVAWMRARHPLDGLRQTGLERERREPASGDELFPDD